MKLNLTLVFFLNLFFLSTALAQGTDKTLKGKLTYLSDSEAGHQYVLITNQDTVINLSFDQEPDQEFLFKNVELDLTCQTEFNCRVNNISFPNVLRSFSTRANFNQEPDINKTILVAIVEFNDYSAEYNKQDIEAMFFSEEAVELPERGYLAHESLKTFYSRVSKGNINFTGDVYDNIHVDFSQELACSYADGSWWLWINQAKEILIARGIDVDSYDYHAFIPVSSDFCSARAYFNSKTSVSNYQYGTQTFVHELGHNLGLEHSSSELITEDYLAYMEYGDHTDFMGFEGTDSNVISRQFLGDHFNSQTYYLSDNPNLSSLFLVPVDSNVDGLKQLIIYKDHEDTDPLYLSYNLNDAGWRTLLNANTPNEYREEYLAIWSYKLLIHKNRSSDYLAKSVLIGKLAQEESFNFLEEQVRVSVNTADDSGVSFDLEYLNDIQYASIEYLNSDFDNNFYSSKGESSVIYLKINNFGSEDIFIDTFKFRQEEGQCPNPSWVDRVEYTAVLGVDGEEFYNISEDQNKIFPLGNSSIEEFNFSRSGQGLIRIPANDSKVISLGLAFPETLINDLNRNFDPGNIGYSAGFKDLSISSTDIRLVDKNNNPIFVTLSNKEERLVLGNLFYSHEFGKVNIPSENDLSVSLEALTDLNSVEDGDLVSFKYTVTNNSLKSNSYMIDLDLEFDFNRLSLSDDFSNSNCYFVESPKDEEEFDEKFVCRHDLILAGQSIENTITLVADGMHIGEQLAKIQIKNILKNSENIFEPKIDPNLDNNEAVVDFSSRQIAPVADFDFKYKGTKARFYAHNSYDKDGYIVSYDWDFFADGTIFHNGKQVDFDFKKPGKYSVVLYVTDNDGLTGSVKKNIIIEDKEAPTVPSYLRASNISFRSADIFWNSSQDNVAVTKYKVRVVSVTSGSISKRDFETERNKFKLKDMLLGSRYSIYVQAYDASGNHSAWSSPLIVRPRKYEPSKLWDIDGSGSVDYVDSFLIFYYIKNNFHLNHLYLRWHLRNRYNPRKARQINAYLDKLKSANLLDLDLDGSVSSAKDGSLFVRFLREKPLEQVQDLVSKESKRKTVDDIKEFIMLGF